MSKEAARLGQNPWLTIADLPLSDDQTEIVLEWYARRILAADLRKGIDSFDKSYDPLVIEGNIAHSYVFDLADGGRHHPFGSLEELERMLDKELDLIIRPEEEL